MSTAILILHHKKVKLTINCLESLKQQSTEDFHIYLLVQGAEREDQITLFNLYSNWPKITIVNKEKNYGFAEGNNILIRTALADPQTKYIITLNNDTTVDKNFVQEIIKPLTLDSDIGMVQAEMKKMNEPNQIDCLGIELMYSGLPFNIKNYDKQNFICCPSAGAAAYSRSLLEQTKIAKQVSSGFESRIEYDYFDSRFFAYCEDLDLGLRARHLGFKPTLANQAVCYHLGSATTSVMSEFAVYHTYRNLIWTLYKNLPAKTIFKLSPWIISGWTALGVNFAKKRMFKIFIRALRDAYKNLSKFTNDRRHILSSSKLTASSIKEMLTLGIVDNDYLKY